MRLDIASSVFIAIQGLSRDNLWFFHELSIQEGFSAADDMYACIYLREVYDVVI